MAGATTTMGAGESVDVDFSAFVISLGSTAAMQLDPSHESYNLELARQTIDILAMLQVKTAGNLTKDEADLLSGVLYQTRLAFCEADKR
ncbi:MAG: DUF1844 domain-containing protein [Deltaproteobacteria bacterium]|nr:DUF1844 domain-containing protein [Deltaproteobacteria bacterium]